MIKFLFGSIVVIAAIGCRIPSEGGQVDKSSREDAKIAIERIRAKGWLIIENGLSLDEYLGRLEAPTPEANPGVDVLFIEAELESEDIERLTTLRVLSLSINKSRLKKGCLDQIKHMTSLEELHIRATPLNEQDIHSIVQLPNLIDLDLSTTNLTLSELLLLKECRSLKRVNVFGLGLDDEQAQRLVQHMPMIEFRSEEAGLPAAIIPESVRRQRENNGSTK